MKNDKPSKNTCVSNDEDLKRSHEPRAVVLAPAAEMIPVLQLVTVCLSQGPEMPD